MPPLPRTDARHRRGFRAAIDASPALKQWAEQDTANDAMNFAVTEGSSSNGALYELARDESRLAIILNRSHPFYKRLYAPLLESSRPEDKVLKSQLELILIAAARAEAQASTADARRAIEKFRHNWSSTLGAYLRG